MDRDDLKQLLFLAWNDGRNQYHPAKGGPQQRYDYLEFISSVEYKIAELCEGNSTKDGSALPIDNISDSAFVRGQKVQVQTDTGGWMDAFFIGIDKNGCYECEGGKRGYEWSNSFYADEIRAV